MSIHDTVDTAFDLSYLGKVEFPKTDYSSVCILGGGTAGFLTALGLKKSHPELSIKVVASSKVPVIGVGESTTTEIIPFLHSFLGFDPVEFFKEVQPTLKLGIEFDWGQKGKDPFQFNFFAGHLYENFYYNQHTGSFNWPSDLMKENKIPVINTEDSGIHSFLNSIPFAYHIDNKSLITYLQKKVIKEGIEIIDEKVTSISRGDNGVVTAFVCDSGSKLESDFFIDCSGFTSFLLGKELGEEFVSFESTLLCDGALTFCRPNFSEPSPYTGAITMESGWCWKIPMRDEDHFGYVHASSFATIDDLKKEIHERFGEVTRFKYIPFKSGRHKRCLIENVFALGNSYAFIEPLESTAIQTLIQSLMILCRQFPKDARDNISRESINAEVAENWDSFRAFLAIHYKFNHASDSKFWKFARENVELGRAKKILDLYKKRAPLSYSHFGSDSLFVALPDLVFNNYSYDSLLMGQGVGPEFLPKPSFSKQELEDRLKSYEELSQIALTQKELFSEQERFIEMVLAPLFDTDDSWILETSV
ncbi:MAG: tryptophan 7-halogenase [Bdellovibrionales bacterium]